MSKTCKISQIIKFGIYLTLFTPLLIAKSTLFPFIFGKAIAFQIIVEVLFILWLILLVQGKIEVRWTKIRTLPGKNLVFSLRSKINIALLVFFAILILSTLLSLDITRSFWSTSERMTGLFNWLHFGAYFLILSTVFKKRDFTWLLRISLFVSVIISIYALIDWMPRLQGTLGNPGFLACYLLFNLFFALYLFFKNKNIYWRISYILISILNFIVFYLTRTRGAYLGLFIGLLLFAFLFALKSSKKIGIALLIAFILIGSLGVYFQKSRFLQAEQARTVSWKISWSAFKERPIFGWGPENYILAFAKHFDPEWPITQWFDKAHSNIWEFAVTTGALGLAAYLAIFVVSFSPILIAYFITNLFWMDTTTSLMLFFIVLVLCEKKFFSQLE